MRPPRPLTIGLALTLAAGALLWAPPAVSSQPISEKERAARPRFAPGELLVRFRPGTPAAERASVRSRQGITRIRSLPLAGLELVRVQGDIPAAAARIGGDPAVHFAEPNFLWYPDQIPDDPEFDELWGLHNTGQTGGTPDADIDAPEAWELAADTSGIVVAVIDTGVWIDHPDLQDAIWTNPGESGGGKETNGVDDDGNGFIDDVHGWDFFNNDATVFDATQPDDHGTHVAGTIAAAFDNATDVTGVSRARIMPLKFLGPQGGTTAAAIQAIDYAIDNEAHLTNNSWGGGAFSSALQAKIEEANVAGQLFVAAAGNGGDDGVGDDNDVAPHHYPASYPNDNVISVAATTHADGLASFSNFGAASVDLGAPGDRILSTVPRFAKAVLVGPDTDAPVSSRSAYHTFGLEGISSSAHRQAVLSAALAWMEVSTADPILVVADDGPASFQAAYTDALGALGFTDVDTSIVPTGNHGPTAGTMSAYEAVIWFTGNQFSSTLTLNDQAALGTYLAGGAGRNLLLFGQDIGYDLTTDGTIVNTFIRDTLRADYVADYDANFRPSGIPGTPYAAVPTIQLSQSTGSGGQFFSSALEPRTGAVAGMRGAPTTWFNGTSMATPHVSGAAALVLATHPSLGHLDVKARLMDRGDPAPALAGKTVSGKRLNLASALETDLPGAPTSLSATIAAGGQIDLSWTASPGPDAIGYNVYRDTTSGFPPSPANRINVSLVTGTEYVDSNTVDGTTYHYIVRAENSGGDESANSNEASATADATPPQVTDTTPLDTATNVPVDAQVAATFDEQVDPSTLGPSTFTLTGPGGAVDGDISYDSSRTTATFTPDANLGYTSGYTAEVTTGVQDLAGNPLPAGVIWSFETTSVDTIAPVAQVDEPIPGETISVRPHTVTGTATDDVEVSGVEVVVRRDDDLTYWNGVGFVPEETWNEATIIPGIGAAVTWSLEWMPPVADGEPFTVLVRATDASDNMTDPPAETAFSVDNTAPTGSVSIQAGAAFTADTAVTLTLFASDGTGVADMRVANESEPSGPHQPFTEALAWDLDAGPDGPRSVHVRFRDEAGNESTVVVDDIVLDTTPPTALPDPLGAFQRDRRFDVDWTGSDETSGLDEFRVEVREAALKGGWSPWTEWLTTPETSASFLGKPGRTYCFRVSAADLVGNSSEPETACTAVPANDRGLNRKGSWRDRSAGRSYLGTFTVSKQRGDRLIVGRVRAREITLVHTRCRRCGKVEVLFKGKVIRRLSLRAPTTKRQAIRKIVAFDGVRSGKLVIVVRSNGRKVPVEGVGVSRA